MRSWLLPASRVREATPEQVLATGAAGAAYSGDQLDGERGWRLAGGGHREIPWWTTEKARIYSVAAYRSNPMARAIIDTYVAFCVGDSGVKYQATNPQVAAIVEEFWTDPRVRLGDLQEQLLRDHMLMGETALRLLVGAQSGVVRFAPEPVSAITDVRLLGGNPLWPHELVFGNGVTDEHTLRVAAIDDMTGLRSGDAMWWCSWKALLDDVRGDPFLSPILDHLDSYDTVISNLIDRTALMRYLVWDVTVKGDQTEVDKFVAARGGVHAPGSGSVEVHNEGVTWEPKSASTGADEDSTASQSVLTLVAGGSGLSKTWLAEPDGANRATSLSMAEPVRRRVGGVQKLWLGYQTELVRFAVDQAVRARRLPQMVTARDPRTGAEWSVRASQTVTVTGPSISASDAEFTAKILLNLSTGLEKMVKSGALSAEAARIAARKAWEDYMGVPYTAELDSPEADPADVAQVVGDAQRRSGERYDPHQKRDEDGQWSKTAGSGPSIQLPARRGRQGGGAAFMARPNLRHLIETADAGDYDRLTKELGSVYDGPYAGLTAKTRTAGTDIVDGYTAVFGMVDVYDGESLAGSVVEVIVPADPPYASHGYISLDEEYRGQGFGRKFMRRAEDWYREIGLDHVELEANIDIGGYAWARSGYDFKTQQDADRILGRLEKMVSRAMSGDSESPPERLAEQIEAARALLARARATEFGSVDYPTPYDISALGRWSGAGKDDSWIGKVTLLGSHWDAVKPLD